MPSPSSAAEVLPLLGREPDAQSRGEGGSREHARGWRVSVFAAAALAFVCAASLASAAGASDLGAFAARLGSARRHGSSESGAHRRSAGSRHASALGTHHHSSVTSHCQNVPADNAAGTYQFSDSRCGDGAMGSVPGCVGDKHNCRFCQTSIVPKHSLIEGWPTCPASVCAELKALGCKGESSASKKEVLWQLAREKALAHNAAVKGVSVGKCATTAADRKIGRHQFSDAGACTRDSLGPGCLGGGSTCRLCQLSTSKADSTGWPVCPDVVCKKWKVKGGGCEPPLSLVTVPPKHPPADFDVAAAMDEQAEKMKAAIDGQEESADEGDDDDDDDARASRKSRRTRATGDLVVDLLQSEDRGADGLDEHLRRAYAKKSSSKSKRHALAA